MRKIGLASLFTVLSTALILPSGWCDDSIVVDLPSSRAPVTQPTAAPTTSGSAEFNAFNRKAGATRAASGQQAQGAVESVIGRLGVAASATTIFASRSSGARGRALARIPSGTYLALTHQAGDWWGVLMADQTTGWIPKRSVTILNYEVVAPKRPEGQVTGYGSALLSNGQQAVLNEAYRYLGIPYRYGGSSADGIDCSAFVQHCFGALGLGLPRTAHEQMACGMDVSSQPLEPADRVYFRNRDGRISHTGIYIGDGFFIHASASRHGVAVSRLTEPMYSRMYAGARR